VRFHPAALPRRAPGTLTPAARRAGLPQTTPPLRADCEQPSAIVAERDARCHVGVFFADYRPITRGIPQPHRAVGKTCGDPPAIRTDSHHWTGEPLLFFSRRRCPQESRGSVRRIELREAEAPIVVVAHHEAAVSTRSERLDTPAGTERQWRGGCSGREIPGGETRGGCDPRVFPPAGNVTRIRRRRSQRWLRHLFAAGIGCRRPSGGRQLGAFFTCTQYAGHGTHHATIGVFDCIAARLERSNSAQPNSRRSRIWRGLHGASLSGRAPSDRCLLRCSPLRPAR